MKTLNEDVIRGGIAVVIPQQPQFDIRDKATNDLPVRVCERRENKDHPKQNDRGQRVSLIPHASIHLSIHPPRWSHSKRTREEQGRANI
jgi:rRNA maturation protein Nop10